MAQPVIQHAFNTGEWAPELNARVDLQKYHRGAAKMLNFYVDYRGGASTRPGTKFVITTRYANLTTRLIPFQASFDVSYVLEFGHLYVRFISNGGSVVEPPFAITAASQSNPLMVTAPGHNYGVSDALVITGVGGMTQLNNRNFLVDGVSGDVLTLKNPDTTPIDATGYGAYTSGGLIQRVYLIASPYTSDEVGQIKFAQIVNQLILCHPNHPPQVLTLIAATNWTLGPVIFGANISPPTSVTVASTNTSAPPLAFYAYVVTSVDVHGQESGPSPYATIHAADMHAQQMTNTVSWVAAVGAQSYNVYKANESFAAPVPSGSQFGFIGNCTGTSFIDSGIPPNFELGVPLVASVVGSLTGILVTDPGSYAQVPTVTLSAPPAPPAGSTVTATAQATLTAAGTPTVVQPNQSVNGGYAVNDRVTFAGLPGLSLVVRTAQVFPSLPPPFNTISYVTSYWPIGQGGSTGGSLASDPPANPLFGTNGKSVYQALVNINWGVGDVHITNPGSGYVSAPTVSFNPGGAAATAFVATGSEGGVDPLSLGNPTVPTFFQQRLWLAGPPQGVQSFFGSQPGAFFNFNISDPIQADDAMSGSLVSNSLNTIRSMVAMPTGLMMLCDRQAFLLDGGTPGSAVTPIDAVAHSEAYNGVSNVPPILANYDILYVQAKGSIVRDLTYNFYTNIYTGTDISVLSSHLFFGKTIKEWAWAEEPYKVAWAVRSDGLMLSLTFLKEQEVVGWAQHQTQGNFLSVCAVTEAANAGPAVGIVDVDATYVIVQRFVDGIWQQFIERMADRFILGKANNAWTVDCALQYAGPAVSTVTGLWHLVGQTVTGLADGIVITPRVVQPDATVTLDVPATTATLGLGYQCQLQTLRLDTGDPTIQGKRKKIPAVSIRVQDALGLFIGKTFSTLVPMKDLIVGNVGTMSDQVVTDLVTDDVRTLLDPSWDVPGQYCIQQTFPLPATVLGVMPEVTVGDTPK